MSRFQYQAIQTSGQRVQGSLRARDRHEALGQLIQRGYHPLAVEAVDENRSDLRRSLVNLRHWVTRTDLAVFTRQMAALLKAGLTVLQTLRTLREQCGNPRLTRIIQDMEEKLQRDGGTLAEALEDHPRVFDGVYRGLVHSGEEGGNLVRILSELGRHLSQTARLHRQVVAAFIYPLFLLILGTIAVFVLMTFVIPRFQDLFASFGSTLPAPTRILITISGFLADWWWLVLAAVTAVILLVIILLRRPIVRHQVDRRVLQFPVLGSMLLKLELVRLSRTLAALIQGGLPILEALRITDNTLRNQAVRASLAVVYRSVSAGEGLAAGMEKSKIYPPLALNLVRTGEETGELPEMLGELSEIYEDEAERAVTAAVKLLEPVLICGMGVLIAGIIAAVILPIFRVNMMAS